MRKKPWDSEKYAARTPLSIVVNRAIKLVRAPAGSQHWKEGLLLVLDAETDELLATTHPNFRDPKTRWDLRTDC